MILIFIDEIHLRSKGWINIFQVIAQFGDVGRVEVDEKTFYLVGVFFAQ